MKYGFKLLILIIIIALLIVAVSLQYYYDPSNIYILIAMVALIWYTMFHIFITIMKHLLDILASRNHFFTYTTIIYMLMLIINAAMVMSINSDSLTQLLGIGINSFNLAMDLFGLVIVVAVFTLPMLSEKLVRRIEYSKRNMKGMVALNSIIFFAMLQLGVLVLFLIGLLSDVSSESILIFIRFSIHTLFTYIMLILLGFYSSLPFPWEKRYRLLDSPDTEINYSNRKTSKRTRY